MIDDLSNLKMAVYKNTKLQVFFAVAVESEEEAKQPGTRVRDVLNRAGTLYETLCVVEKVLDLKEHDMEITPENGLTLYHYLARDKDAPLYEVFNHLARGWFCNNPLEDGTPIFVFFEKEHFLQLYGSVSAYQDGNEEIRNAFGPLCDSKQYKE